MCDQIPEMGTGNRLGNAQQIYCGPVGSQDLSVPTEGHHRFPDPVNESLQLIPLPLQSLERPLEYPPAVKGLSHQDEHEDEQQKRKEFGGN